MSGAVEGVDTPAGDRPLVPELEGLLAKAIAEAFRIADESFGYNLSLTRLVDGESTYTLRMAGFDPVDVEDMDAGYEIVAQRRVEHRAKAILPLLKAAQADGERVAAWQPIETAPRDRAIIGGYFDQPWAESHREGRIVECWFQPEFDCFISSCREMRTHNGHTFEDGSTRRLHSETREDVTHWLPKPPAPARAALSEGSQK